MHLLPTLRLIYVIAFLWFFDVLARSNSIICFVVKVGVLHEEKILPLGKCISAVGICNSKDGIPEIKSCKELPYFL
jgi:hypothetical protein